MTRRQFFKRSLISTALAAGGGFGWGLYEVRKLTVEKVRLSAKLGPEAPKTVTIAQISDLHLDPGNDEAWVQCYVSAINALKPDLVAITGDFITGSGSALKRLAPLLGQLQAAGGVFACLGNHDQWHMPGTVATRILQDEGLRVLNNESVSVELPGGRTRIAGVESIWGGQPLPAKALAKAQPEEPSIFLAHEPDVALLFPKELPIAIQLSGHTHGGQICVPPGKPIRLPKYGRILARGLYETQAPWPVYVNRGIGTLFPHLRFAASPEITLMELQNLS